MTEEDVIELGLVTAETAAVAEAITTAEAGSGNVWAEFVQLRLVVSYEDAVQIENLIAASLAAA